MTGKASFPKPCSMAKLLILLAIVPAAAGSTGRASADAVYVDGVPDFQQENFPGANDCTPVAASEILAFWDARGHDNLVAGPGDYAANPAGVADLVTRLKVAMRWTSSGTQVVSIAPGIQSVASASGYAFASFTYYAALWANVRTHLLAGQPPILTMMHPLYQNILHSVSCVGFDERDSARIIIVHDNWIATPEDVYLNFDECASRSLTAVVPPAAVRTLTVRSSGACSIAILGTYSGSTDFQAATADREQVTVIAPLKHSAGGTAYRLTHWVLDDVDQLPQVTKLSFPMLMDRTAVAVYEVEPLLGDVNQDCRVNVLDLLYVRDRLGRNAFSSDYWRADVNADGRINILDLLRVRDQMGAACPE